MHEGVILLVEDNRDDQDLTLRALRRNNIRNEIVIANDGVEALDYLFATGSHSERDPSQTPVLVLLDLKLPKVDGLQVLARLRADPRTSFLPVVILTSSTEDRDLVESYRSGANSYVQKPVDFVEFTEAVHQLGLYWLILNRAPPGVSHE